MKDGGISIGMGNEAPSVPEVQETKQGTLMSVTKMGELLGLKRTERYWLINKNLFEIKTALGKTWVDVASFENWYANQFHYRKVNGEEPGLQVKAWSYSVQDLSELLGITKSSVYRLIKREQLETVSIDFRLRIPRDAFAKWYSSQNRYRTVADRRRNDTGTRSMITVPQMAALLGISLRQAVSILESKKYGRCFECIYADGQRRITQADFEKFLKSQDRFHRVAIVRLEDYAGMEDEPDLSFAPEPGVVFSEASGIAHKADMTPKEKSVSKGSPSVRFRKSRCVSGKQVLSDRKGKGDENNRPCDLPSEPSMTDMRKGEGTSASKRKPVAPRRRLSS